LDINQGIVPQAEQKEHQMLGRALHAALVFTSFMASEAQAGDWAIHVYWEAMHRNSRIKGQHETFSEAWVWKTRETDYVYRCKGGVTYVEKGDPKVFLSCAKEPLPVAGDLLVTGGRQIWSPYEAPRRDGFDYCSPYRNYFWVIASTLDSLRFCDATVVQHPKCSDAPTLVGPGDYKLFLD
jgi:predicted small secreted protein